MTEQERIKHLEEKVNRLEMRVSKQSSKLLDLQVQIKEIYHNLGHSIQELRNEVE